jgi:hypothetical protein
LAEKKRKGFLEVTGTKKTPRSDDSHGLCRWSGPEDVFELFGNSQRNASYLAALSQVVYNVRFQAMFMQCVPIKAASKSTFSTKFAECSRAAGLRSFIEAFLREEGTRWEPKGHLWPRVECIAERSMLDLIDLEFENDHESKDWLRHMIAVDYYFYLETTRTKSHHPLSGRLPHWMQ